MKQLKAIMLAFMIAAITLLCQNSANAFLFKKKITKSSTPVFTPVNDANGNKIWIGTFQLVWNDLMNNVIHTPVEFKGKTPELALLLNKQGFTDENLSNNSYYQAHGIMKPALKKEIEKNIFNKFGEKSDILDGMNWNSKGYLVYAMLYKNFEYLQEFDILDPSEFKDKKVKFFGINQSSNKETRKNTEVLFYNNENDYAVKLITKSKDEVILYRTDENITFEKYFAQLNNKTKNFKGNRKFTGQDTLKVPFINLNRMFSYEELTGQKIKGTKFTIEGAIQTAKFNLDNKGGTLKSEAALIMRMSLMRPEENGHDFNFDKPFVLFLKEKDKAVPYFIMTVQNADLLEEVYK